MFSSLDPFLVYVYKVKFKDSTKNMTKTNWINISSEFNRTVQKISYLPMHRIRQRLISFRLGIINLTSFLFSQNKHLGHHIILSNDYTELCIVLYLFS